MNGLPATIVIRHLMSEPAPAAQRHGPRTRTAGRKGARAVVLRVAVPLVVVTVVVSFVFAIAGYGPMAA